ncbi:MAG TPA: indolepyruvate ferredoxin oxidoreductase subunit alpha [Methanoregulaceae archaeon]|nr:indolepyruvate ferredoxin oxidoreductase subunit alpha [Methanoregulaceae archaeon]
MARQYLLGNEAIAHAALEGGVGFVAGYPGTPSSEVIDLLRARRPEGVHVEWSTNEKVAFENALAAAWCGVRALFTTKHVGLNVAADPLMTSAYTGVTGGFVVLSADDPFAHSSQNEQDSRLYAAMAGLPCLDPGTIEEAHAMLRDAFALSEEFGLPVLFRPTTRICHSKADVELGPVPSVHREPAFVRDPRQYVVVPAHTRVLHRRLNEKQAVVRARLAGLGLNTGEIRGCRAVVAGGVAAEYVREVLPDGVSLFVVRAYPVDPGQLQSFCLEHEEVLVVEEGAPVLEDEVKRAAGSVPVYGKRTGHVPGEGELSPALVRAALASAGFVEKAPPAPPAPVEGLPPRPPILCAGCMHRAVFYAMKRVFREGIFPSDIGCYTLGLQLGTVDTTICMGASITIGSGIAQTVGGDVVATIGDSTFLHTGLPGLVNAVYNGANMVLVILDNRVTAMTGHQPNPTTGVTATGEERPKVSLEALCRACGVEWVETVDPYDLPGLIATLREVRAKKGVRVVIAKKPCVIVERRARVKRPRLEVDPSACSGCRTCLRFGCPAIAFEGKKASITDLCSGCGVCASLCPEGAIGKESRPPAPAAPSGGGA